jgi:hypothetical protein
MQSIPIELDNVRAVYVRDSGWVQVQAFEECFFTLGEASHPKAGKRAWRLTSTSGEVWTVTPAMIEAITE